MSEKVTKLQQLTAGCIIISAAVQRKKIKLNKGVCEQRLVGINYWELIFSV